MLFICGQPGTGKTSLMNEIMEKNLKSHEFSFKIYLNCMSFSSIKEFYEQIFKFFNKSSNLIKLQDLHVKNYNEIIKILKLTPNKDSLSVLLPQFSENLLGVKLTLVILLDEIDNFYQKNDETSFFEILIIPYTICRDLKITMISNDSDFDKFILPKIENRKLKMNKYVFQPYTHIEIMKIISKKLEQMGYLEYFEESALRFMCSKLANKSGDLRPVLEVIKQIILNSCDQFKNSIKINLKDVMNVLKQKQSHFTEIIQNLTFEQKVVVCSIYFSISSVDCNVVGEDDVYFYFKIIIGS